MKKLVNTNMFMDGRSLQEPSPAPANPFPPSWKSHFPRAIATALCAAVPRQIQPENPLPLFLENSITRTDLNRPFVAKVDPSPGLSYADGAWFLAAGERKK